MILAALMISSMEMLPLCLMFFTFFLSRGGSLSALITRAAAEGTTVTWDYRKIRHSGTGCYPFISNMLPNNAFITLKCSFPVLLLESNDGGE
jgi:hypothetical protein